MTRGPDLKERVDRLVSRPAPRTPSGPTSTLVSVSGALFVIAVLVPHVIAQPECQAGDIASRPTYDVLATRSEPVEIVSDGDRSAGFEAPTLPNSTRSTSRRYR